MAKFNEEHYEQHYIDIAENIENLWTKHKCSCFISNYNILFNVVHTVAEMALKDGIKQPMVEKIINDAMNTAYEMYLAQKE